MRRIYTFDRIESMITYGSAVEKILERDKTNYSITYFIGKRAYIIELWT